MSDAGSDIGSKSWTRSTAGHVRLGPTHQPSTFPAWSSGLRRIAQIGQMASGLMSILFYGIERRSRMGGRVVDGSSLENWRAGNRSVGSNPTPSAILH